MAWWSDKCPVREHEQRWIDESMDWFVDQFGRDRLCGVMVLPTDGFFPGAYEGSRDDVRRVFAKLCEHMGVDQRRVTLEHEQVDDAHRATDLPLQWTWRGAAGHYRKRNGRAVICVRDDQANQPMALVATIAHELGHVLLLGDRRITADREDHEPLTDLLTVFFGLGIFPANAAFHYGPEAISPDGRTIRSTLGYLTEPMYGYGLARYAWLRGETDPEWARYLDTNPRAFLKQGLRHLRHSRPASL